MSNDKYTQFCNYIDDHKNEMMAMWKDFVETPSWARNKDAAWAMGDKLVEIFKNMDMRIAEHDVGETNSRIIEAFWNETAPGKSIMFGGHYDTVNNSLVENPVHGAENEFDGTPHFRIDSDGKAYGLGVLDMKGGLVIAIWIVKGLQAIGWKERPIRFLLAGDEDKGHFDGNAPELLTELAKGALCCFNMETGRVSNEICVGRKGGGEGEMWVHGVTAHAGNDFLSGRNAILEMAYKEIELSKITNLDLGTTVTPTVITGGTVPNGIPEYCHIYFDVRYRSMIEKDRVKKAIKDIASMTFIDGTSTEYKYKEYMIPFDETEYAHTLADFMSEESEHLGYGKMEKINLGGSSDGCYFTMAGVPTVCALGVKGKYNHSAKEYALVESLFERAKIIGCTVLDINKIAEKLEHQ